MSLASAPTATLPPPGVAIPGVGILPAVSSGYLPQQSVATTQEPSQSLQIQSTASE